MEAKNSGAVLEVTREPQDVKVNLSTSHDVARVVTCFIVALARYTSRDRIGLLVEGGDWPGLWQIDVPTHTTFAELARMASSRFGNNLDLSLVFAPGPEIASELGSLCVAGRNAGDPAVPLRLRCVPGDRTAQLEFTSAWQSGFAAQFGWHFRILMEEAEADPSQRVWQVQIVRGAERRGIVVDWNRTERPYAEVGVPELLAQRARACPSATALVFGEERVSCRELNQRANRLARRLRMLGLGPGRCAGFFLENSIQAVVSVVAILKAGGAYVPLDPDHPAQRLTQIAADAQLVCVITRQGLKARASGFGMPVVCLEECANEIAAEDADDFDSGSNADSPAYVIYTSGTTGRPSGVIGTQRSILNGLHETLFDPSDPDEVCCLNGAMSVVYLVLGLFLPLICGVPLVLMSSEQYRDPLLLAAVLEKERVTNLAIPTPSLRQLLDLGGRITERLRSLKVAMVGGAFLSPELIRRFRELLPAVRLLKAYGCSELGGLATKGIATEGNSVGKAVSNVRIYILGEDSNPVPLGVTGQIHIGAPHLARGYLNEPELTGARFVSDSFCDRSGARMLRTGDLGRFTLDGEVEFLGRLDDLVKVRGYRVYLAEVESAVREHAAIRDLALTVREMDGEARIAAWVVRQPGANLSAPELRQFVRERLPDYMVPSAIAFVECIPRLTSGKPHLHALPAPGSIREETADFMEAGDPVEAFLIDLWREILGFDTIGANDHFLELGGDSLFASRVAARVWEMYGIELEQVALFEHPTIAEYAAEIRSRLAGSEMRRKAAGIQ